MTAGAQTQLHLVVSTHQPLMTIESARGWLPGRDEDDILDLISLKRIAWAFDLRTAGAVRCEVRIFAPCVPECVCFLNGLAVPQSYTFDNVIFWLFPHKREYLGATELKRAFNTSSTHIHNLIRDRLIHTVPGTGDNINRTPTVTRQSVTAFLKERQL
jgi:hypothetical protein